MAENFAFMQEGAKKREINKKGLKKPISDTKYDLKTNLKLKMKFSWTDLRRNGQRKERIIK